MGGGRECWCWGALDPLNLGEGRSHASPAWVCTLSCGQWPGRHLLQGSDTPGEEGDAELALPDFAGSGPGLREQEFPGTKGAQAEDGAEAALTTVGEREGVVMVRLPLASLLRVGWWWWGSGVRAAFRQFELFFPGSGTAAKTQGLSAPRVAALPTSPASRPCCMPTSQSQEPSGPPLWQAWARAPSQERRGGASSWPLGKMLTPTP